jgi:preprotein translocase subunit Sss1
LAVGGLGFLIHLLTPYIKLTMKMLIWP